MQDNRVRIRLSFDPNNQEDSAILDYLNNAGEGISKRIKKCIMECMENKLEPVKEEETGGNCLKYDLIKETIVDESKKKNKYLFPFKRKKNKDKSVIKKYEVEENEFDKFENLEKYIIEKKLESDVMTMLAMAIDCGVDSKTIFSMVENGLDAKQIRALIDVDIADKQVKNRAPNLRVKNKRKNEIKENDPLAIDIVDLDEND